MRRYLHILQHSLLSAMISACLLFPVFATAQDKAKSQVAERLQTKVSVTLGTVTLPEVLAALSKQTGLIIQAEPYLQERKIFVQLNGVTARAALDALAELHDWTWRDMDENRILNHAPQSATFIRGSRPSTPYPSQHSQRHP